MSYQSHTKKPSLPSIHFLLNDPIPQPCRYDSSTTSSTSPTSVTQPTISPPLRNSAFTKKHARQSHSISSLPSELQQLSLSAPAFNNIPTSASVDRSENHQPSWMMMPPSSVPQQQRKLSGHTRSMSEFSAVSLPPMPSNISTKNRHRRSVSANNTISSDFYNMMNSSLPYIDELYNRAHTDSPPPNDQQQQQLFDALNIQKKEQDHHHAKEGKEYENVVVARDEQTGRYYCPFCNKAFNRPSSLRIHTYSHTGEKPFVCLEEGCGRQFSVQSNMRRHLRVHRVGRSKK